MQKPTKEIIYYCYDSKKSPKMLEGCREQLRKAGLPIIYLSDSPITNVEANLPMKKFIPDWGVGHYVLYHGMFKKVLMGLELSTADYCFMAEDDVIYHPSHFDFTPPTDNEFWYNENCWHLRDSDGFAIYYTAKRLSQMSGNRKFLIQHFRKRLEIIESIKGRIHWHSMGFEPGTHNREERIDDFKAREYMSAVPSIDIKSGLNATVARWKQSDFRSQKNCQNWKEADWNTIPGWTKDELTSVLGM